MNKTVLLSAACFLTGTAIGFFAAPKEKSVDVPRPLILRLSSQGRAAVTAAAAQINAVLDEETGKMMADKTRSLQAVATDAPDRAAAEFHAFGFEKRFCDVQARIDLIMLDALEQMPRIDRRAYMDFYLENRSNIRSNGVVLPLISATGFAQTDKKE